MTGGAVCLAAGVLYGLQCLVHWTQTVGITHLGRGFMIVFVAAISVIFVAVLSVVLWKDRKSRQHGVGTRALNAAFAGAGIANLVICAVLGLVAVSERSIIVWLLYAVVICAVQGAAWYVAAVMRRLAWLGLVSAGWYVTALGLGVVLYLKMYGAYCLLLCIALLLLLALPGWVMLRQAGTVS